MNLSALHRSTASKPLLWAVAILLVASFILAVTARPAAAASDFAQWHEVSIRADMTAELFQGGITMISASLTEDAPLPARVHLLVPTGVDVLWAGEVLGGATSANPQIDFDRAVLDGQFDSITTTLTRARTLQVEWEGVGAIASSPTSVAAGVTWRTPSLIPTLRMGVVVPSGSILVTGPARANPAVIDANRSIFYQEWTNVAPGQDMEFRIVYTPGTPGARPEGPAGQDGWSGYMFPIFAVVFLVGVATVLLAVSAKRKRELAKEEYADED